MVFLGGFEEDPGYLVVGEVEVHHRAREQVQVHNVQLREVVVAQVQLLNNQSINQSKDSYGICDNSELIGS